MPVSALAIVAKVDPAVINRKGKPVVTATIKTFGKRAIDIVGSDNVYNMSSVEVQKYLKKWSAKKVTEINNTTRHRLRKVITEAVGAGDTTEQIAKKIGHVFEVAKGSRSIMIARTEVGTASNFASLSGYSQVGIEEKEWQSTIDNATRDTHIGLDGQVRDMDDLFETDNGDTAEYPGGFGIPEEDINCRCGVLPRVNERRIRGNRLWLWKSLERARLPWDRKMASAMREAFRIQEKAVMAEFESQAGKVAA